MILAPGGEAVIAANTGALAAVHSPPAGRMLFGPFAGALSNDGELFGIRDANGAVIKEFTYGITAPWPNGSGFSLVLINPASNPDHSLATNRRAGASGGTPWNDGSPPFTGVWTADTDGDGFPDGIEYVLGTLTGSIASGPQIGYTVIGGNILEITFRRIMANDRGTISPELFLELAAWQPAAFIYTGSTPHGDGTATETWRATVPGGSAAYARLRVTAP